MNCPHCHQTVPVAPFCANCSRLLPAVIRPHWEVLGYNSEVMNLEASDLERRFFDLSRKFHPDRYASKSALEVQLAHDHSSAVNNAYRTLKDPVARANYLVEQKLGSISEKSAHVPPEMADLFFEIQEHLDEIRYGGGTLSESAAAEIHRAETDLNGKVGEMENKLQSLFMEYDGHPDVRTVEQMKQILAERSYIKSFLRQIDSLMKGETAAH